MSSAPKKRVADEVIEIIKQQLESGILKEGDKLPNLTQFAKDLGVSRLSVREAIQTLEKLGAVKSRPKIGTIIICGDPSRWSYPLLSNEFEDPKMIDQLFEVRMFFEGFLAAQCAAHAQVSDLKKLEKTLLLQSKALEVGDLTEFYRYDTQFHTQLASTSKNLYMQRLYTELLQSTNPSVTAVLRTLPDAVQDSLYMHQRILEAITNLDVSSAEHYARMHLRRLKEYYDTKD